MWDRWGPKWKPDRWAGRSPGLFPEQDRSTWVLWAVQRKGQIHSLDTGSELSEDRWRRRTPPKQEGTGEGVWAGKAEGKKTKTPLSPSTHLLTPVVTQRITKGCGQRSLKGVAP